MQKTTAPAPRNHLEAFHFCYLFCHFRWQQKMAARSPVKVFATPSAVFHPLWCVSHICPHCCACPFSFEPPFGPLQAFIKCHTANFPTDPNPPPVGFSPAKGHWHLSRLEISLCCPTKPVVRSPILLVDFKLHVLAVFHSFWHRFSPFFPPFPLGLCHDNFIYFAIFRFKFVSAFFVFFFAHETQLLVLQLYLLI